MVRKYITRSKKSKISQKKARTRKNLRSRMNSRYRKKSISFYQWTNFFVCIRNS